MQQQQTVRLSREQLTQHHQPTPGEIKWNSPCSRWTRPVCPFNPSGPWAAVSPQYHGNYGTWTVHDERRWTEGAVVLLRGRSERSPTSGGAARPTKWFPFSAHAPRTWAELAETYVWAPLVIIGGYFGCFESSRDSLIIIGNQVLGHGVH